MAETKSNLKCSQIVGKWDLPNEHNWKWHAHKMGRNREIFCFDFVSSRTNNNNRTGNNKNQNNISFFEDQAPKEKKQNKTEKANTSEAVAATVARAEYAIAKCVNTGRIACHVCNAIELKLESKASESK